MSTFAASFGDKTIPPDGAQIYDKRKSRKNPKDLQLGETHHPLVVPHICVCGIGKCADECRTDDKILKTQEL